MENFKKQLEEEFNLIIQVLDEFNTLEEDTLIHITPQGGGETKVYKCSKLNDLKELYIDDGIRCYEIFDFQYRIERFLRYFIENELLVQSISYLVFNAILDDNKEKLK